MTDSVVKPSNDAQLSLSSGEVNSPRRRNAIVGLMGAALLPMVAACDSGQASKTTFHWDEEVELIDKRVITVRQGRGSSRMYDGQSVVGQPTLGSLRFTLPEIQATPIEWQDKFMPLILNVHEGSVYVGGSPWIGQHFEDFGRPRSGWVVQRYDPSAKAWVRIPASKTPETIRKTNLLINLAPPPSLKLMTLEVKASAEYNGRSRIDAEIKQLDPAKRTTYGSGFRDQDLAD
jgi:hypothetical protein